MLRIRNEGNLQFQNKNTENLLYYGQEKYEILALL